jgi:hypothetical protein
MREAGADHFAMSGTIRVRKVHFDYAGADGLPKPMMWAMASEAAFDRDDYARRARDIFREQFPEWKLRSCAVADEDIEVEAEALHPLPGVAGIFCAH